MKLKRVMALFLTMGMVLSTLTACGGEPAVETDAAKPEASEAAKEENKEEDKEEVKEETGEPVTINFSAFDMASNAYLTEIIAAFEAENENIKVEVLDSPSADYTNKVSVMLNGGSDLDVIFIKDADTTKDLWKKGQLEDLAPYVERDAIDLSVYKGGNETYTFEDELVGMPFRSDFYVMYYNKAIFDEAGVPYPTNDTTWEEFEETAKLITSGDGANKKYGSLIHTWQACVQNWAMPGADTNIMDTAHYDLYKPYYEMALRMQEEDETIMDYGTMKTSNIHYSSPFLQGNVGMMPMGTWFVSTIIAKKEAGESEVDFGIATIPHADGAPVGDVVGAITPFAINKASENKEEAWEFIKFVTGEVGAKMIAETGQIPAIVNDDILNIVAAKEGMPEGILEALQYNSIVPDRPVTENVAEINKMLGEEHGLIMLGELTVDEGITKMKKRADEILAN